jgi:thioredoxin 1
MIKPVLEQIDAEQSDRLIIGELNGDLHPELVQRYGVLGFPTLTLHHDGELIHRIVGARPKRLLLAELDAHLPAGTLTR